MNVRIVCRRGDAAGEWSDAASRTIGKVSPRTRSPGGRGPSDPARPLPVPAHTRTAHEYSI